MSGSKTGSHFKRRRRRGSHLGVTGKLPTALNEHSLFYESLRERDLFVLLSFDPGVEWVEDHPFPIWYGNGKRRRRYTPDAKVIYRDGRPTELIEVKVVSELERDPARYEAPFDAARAYCGANDLTFRVVTDQDMPRPRVSNLRFLLPYRKEPAQPLVEARLRELLTQPTTLAGAVQSLESQGLDPGEIIVEAWRLAAQQQLKIDLDQPLGFQSTLVMQPWSLRL